MATVMGCSACPCFTVVFKSLVFHDCSDFISCFLLNIIMCITVHHHFCFRCSLHRCGSQNCTVTWRSKRKMNFSGKNWKQKGWMRMEREKPSSDAILIVGFDCFCGIWLSKNSWKILKTVFFHLLTYFPLLVLSGTGHIKDTILLFLWYRAH